MYVYKLEIHIHSTFQQPDHLGALEHSLIIFYDLFILWPISLDGFHLRHINQTHSYVLIWCLSTFSRLMRHEATFIQQQILLL